jgi:hypothetical protein
MTSTRIAAPPAGIRSPSLRQGSPLNGGAVRATGRLAANAPSAPAAVAAPLTPRAFVCQCGRPVFFRNSMCLACRTPLGYAPELCQLLPLMPVPETAATAGASPMWQSWGAPPTAPRWRRCANFDSAAACNWLVDEHDQYAGTPPLCRCCRLTRTLPDLSVAGNPQRWNRFELAKRRLVSSLIGMKLPLASKSEDPAHGLVFDLLSATPDAPVVTGHADGVITLDIAEADDDSREGRRAELGEPYRTLLGHLRHECGHYYWQRLVKPSEWLEPTRALFGDERQDYAAALQRHYAQGAPADWGLRFVSAYASSHPWEDWAETWAHYLHLVDTLDTARSFGLDGEDVDLRYEHLTLDALEISDTPEARAFLELINSWMELTGVLNELSRSMGMADFYPFVLSLPAARKLFMVHRVIQACRQPAQA